MADGSFEEFYDATYGRLLKQIILVTGAGATPRTCCRTPTAAPRSVGGGCATTQAPEAWVRRVALRLAIDRARRARRRAAALLRLRPPQSPSVELSADSFDLYNALRGLPPGQRQVVVLHHLVGLPVEEVASQLNMPVGTVKSRLTRGRAALARRLAMPGQEVVSNDR